jgi:hypothetical protein
LRLPFSSPPTTHRVTVEVFDPTSTRGSSFFAVLSYSALYLLGVLNRGHQVEQFISPLSWKRPLHCCENKRLPSRCSTTDCSIKTQSNGVFCVTTGKCSVKPHPVDGQVAAFRLCVTICSHENILRTHRTDTYTEEKSVCLFTTYYVTYPTS